MPRTIFTKRIWFRSIAIAGIGLSLALVVGRCGAASPEFQQNWPQWRGPFCTGVAPLADPPTSWSEDKNIKWKAPIPGSGLASPIVWGNQVFVQTAIPTGRKVERKVEVAVGEPAKPADDAAAKPADSDAKKSSDKKSGPPMHTEAPDEVYQFVLISLDRQTGKELWRQVAREEVPHEGHHPDHGFASFSPVTDGQHVITYFGSRGLHCYDMQGHKLWNKDLGKMHTSNEFGEASSPALLGNTVVVLWDQKGDGDFIAAFDKTTGDELWRTPREEEDTNWSTPLIVQHDGKTEVVTTATGKIRSYDFTDGKQLWECTGMTECAIPTPVAAGDMVYVTSGFRGSNLLAIRLGHTGDLTGGDAIVWSYNKDTPYVPSPLLSGNRLYFMKGNNPIVSCFDVTTGKSLFGPQRLEDGKGDYASPVAAAGRVYLTFRNGVSIVLRDGDQFEVLATNKLDDEINASPAIVGNEIFLRGKENVYCISEK